VSVKPKQSRWWLARRLRAGTAAVIAVAAMFAAPLTLAITQENAPSPPLGAAGQPPAAPAAIPSDEIPRRATEDETRLQEIRLDVDAPDPRAAGIEAGLPDVSAAIGRLEGSPEGQDPDSESLLVLSTLRIQWESHGRSLDDWQRTLQRRSRKLADAAEVVRQMRAVWTPVRAADTAEHAPRALLDRVIALLREMDDVEADVREHLTALLTLQERVSDEQAKVTQALQRITVAEVKARRKLFTLDSDPLWSAAAWPRGAGDIAAQAVQSLRSRQAEITRFAGENAARIRLHVGLFGAMLLAALAARRRSRQWAIPSAASDSAARLFVRPVSATLVLALVATRWLYPPLPPAVRTLLLLAVMPPVLRLLPRFLLERMRASLYRLAGLFFLDRAADFTIGQPLLHRLLLLATVSLGFALFAWTTRRRNRTATQGVWARLGFGLGRIAALTLGIGLIACIVGALALARLLTTATLTSAYLAVVLFAAVLVLDAVVALVLRADAAATLRLVRLHAEALLARARTVIHLLAAFVWLRATLLLLGIHQLLVDGATRVLARRWQYGEFNVSIGDLLIFAIVLGVGFALSRLIPFVLEEGILVRSLVPLGVRATVSTLTRFVVLTLGFLAALAAAGVGLSQFALIAGGLGVGIGFGLQNLVSNFAAGMILAFERPVQVGDIVQVGALVGRVRHIGLRASIVVTFEGAEAIVPNAQLISTELVNWTLSETKRRIELPVGVAFGTEPRRVQEILIGVARAHPEVMRTPEPLALFRGFGESSLNLVLQFWVPSFEDSERLRSEVGVAIHEALKQAGIEVPFPQRDLHVKSVTPAAGNALRGTDSTTEES
jgi:small-conductance mechanosensitive channel